MMKCSRCGTEFDGKYCPECGEKAENSIYSFDFNDDEKNRKLFSKSRKISKQKIKGGKPFYKKWRFIILVVILFFAGRNMLNNRKERIKWDEIVLSYQLPEPPVSKGRIHSNSGKRLDLDDLSVSLKEYSKYVEDCKNMGYTIEAELGDSSYKAFNKEGFKLVLYFRDYSKHNTMSISLDAPMEMKDIQWPISKAGKMLPAPKSNQGNFSYEYEDHFSVYVGNTSFDEYEKYIQSCKERGFTVDYEKGDKYYCADNESGWHISIEYEGFNIMSVNIKAPEEKEETDTKEEKIDTKENNTSKKEEVDDGTINSDFKAAMDSYEAFFDEYIAFMKKYSESDGTDLDLAADYISYLDKYSKFVEDFEKWDDEELNDAEMIYYLEVQTRVSKKLLEAGI